jgi:hypothetical protein
MFPAVIPIGNSPISPTDKLVLIATSDPLSLIATPPKLGPSAEVIVKSLVGAITFTQCKAFPSTSLLVTLTTSEDELPPDTVCGFTETLHALNAARAEDGNEARRKLTKNKLPVIFLTENIHSYYPDEILVAILVSVDI